MHRTIKSGDKLYHFSTKTSKITGCVVASVEEKKIVITLDETIDYKRQLTLPLTHLGEWLFFEKEHVRLSKDKLLELGYGDYGNKRFDNKKERNNGNKSDNKKIRIDASKYIDFFFKRIVGFERTKSRYSKLGNEKNEFFAIAMDKVSRLQRKGGRLRNKVWSSCIFIFHGSDLNPDEVYYSIFEEKKEKYPFLFVRSYVYFVFINIEKEKQVRFTEDNLVEPSTTDYKIWYFNSKYELKPETKRTNIFDIKLNENERIDDYVYLANPVLEIDRIKSVNSDVIDCIKAFTGELSILEQTSEIVDKICCELESNKNAKILLEGPARSGKTIIAAVILHRYIDSKMLLMNYYFYSALIDGLKSLSSFTTEEIKTLVSNEKLDAYIECYNRLNGIGDLEKLLKRIRVNLDYTSEESIHIVKKTKEYIEKNTTIFDLIKVDKTEIPEFSKLIDKLTELRQYLLNNKVRTSLFSDFGMKKIEQLKSYIDKAIVNIDKSEEINTYLELVCSAMERLPVESGQRFFHHDVGEEKGCWIKRGSPTVSKMWDEHYHPQLIICDEFQRLGVIFERPEYDHDKFDEVENLLNNSDQVLLVGDDFQKLNQKYDQGVERISEIVNDERNRLIRITIPDSIGVPAEIGLLLKYLTHPENVNVLELKGRWPEKRFFEIKFINNNCDKFVEIFDRDKANKKHFSIPADYSWCQVKDLKISTIHREKPIVNFADTKKYPYFCNEEIMSKYFLSAYELISREVESIYVHIPVFGDLNEKDRKWFYNHLYVLFTRGTGKVIVNFEDKDLYDEMKKKVERLKNHSIESIIEFID